MGWTGVFADPPDRELDPEDPYADPAALLQHRHAKVREKLVRLEKAKLLRERVQKCYLMEGVNSLQNCKPVVEDYLESIKGLGMARLNSGRYDSPPPKKPLD